MVALMSAACSWSPDSREKELGQQGALSWFQSQAQKKAPVEILQKETEEQQTETERK